MLRSIPFLIFVILLVACNSNKETQTTPWGGEINEDGTPVTTESNDTASSSSDAFTLADIVSNGELIILTVSSPETYYDYHGHGLGIQYLICENFAKKLGVSLRVELCNDSSEVVRRLKEGEGDIAVFEKYEQWQTADPKSELTRELKAWYKPQMYADAEKEQKSILANGFVRRHVNPFMLNRKDAIISKYDALFRQYAPTAGVDWTLLAAQCYQESTFDPQAHSWAGACGLMQIMPSTADLLGLPRSDIYAPEPNIRAAAKYMAQLQSKFSDVRDRRERLCFALASYNGGSNHINDARELAAKYGKSPNRWSDVRQYVLALQQKEYYRDPVVKYGYMRGSETADYVDKIMDRWTQYRRLTKGKFASNVVAPQPAKRQNKWQN